MPISCGLNRFTLRLLQVSLPSLLILTLLMFALTPISRGAHPMSLTTPLGNNETAHNVGMTGGPSLLSEEDSTRAIAFDTIIWQREPFSLTSPSALGQNQRTRVMLFATNLHLMPGETISALKAEAEDGTQALYPLTVEDIVKVPDFDWLSGVVVRLNDDLGVGDVLIRIYHNGIASNRVQIGIRPTPVPVYSIAASVSVVSAGNPLAVTWNIPKNQSKTDWVGLYKVGAPNTDGSELWWRYTGGARNGNLTLNAPLQGGQYEFRLFLNNSFKPAAISNPVTVKSIAPPSPTPTPKPTPTPTPVPSYYSVAASSSAVSAGSPLAVTWSVPSNQSQTDWVGLYKVGSSSANGSEQWWRYTGGSPSGNLTLNAPLQGGQYEFRLFLNNTFDRVASSNSVTVASAPTPNPTPTPTPTPAPTPTPGPGNSWYVATGASGSGDGTFNNPWTIWQMINSPASVQPGDTIYLRGGIYNMRGSLATHWCSVTGTPSAPVTIRNYPGERPAIDWDYIFAAGGAYTHYVGIEWFGSSRKKILSWGWDPERPPALSVYGDGVKFINNVIHDVSEFKISDTAKGAEAYGNLMYYFGFNDPVRSWGTTCYGQARSGPVLLKDNVMMHQFANNLQLYGSDTVQLNNVTVEGNVITHAGELGHTGGFNAVAWPGLTAENINFNNNFFYQPDPAEGTNLSLPGASPSYAGGENPNVNLRVTDNWIIGGGPAIRMGNWNPSEFRNNKIYSEYGLVWASKIPFYTYNWNNNQYYYEGSRTDVMFAMNNPFITSFAAWQPQTGLDSASTFANGFPTGVQVYVRANAYEQGRAHVIIINGDNANSATVSLANTGLQNGQTYEIRDGQDFYGSPALIGTYNSASPNVTLPLNLTAITKIVGWDYAPNFEGPLAVKPPTHSDRRLNVFVVRKTPVS